MRSCGATIYHSDADEMRFMFSAQLGYEKTWLPISLIYFRGKIIFATCAFSLLSGSSSGIIQNEKCKFALRETTERRKKSLSCFSRVTTSPCSLDPRIYCIYVSPSSFLFARSHSHSCLFPCLLLPPASNGNVRRQIRPLMSTLL